MALGRRWAGRAYGTNTGNLFVRLDGEDSALSGTLHLNEPGIGPSVYSLQGQFDGRCLTLTGDPLSQTQGVAPGRLHADAVLNAQGELDGQWSTTDGLAGTFILFPHDQGRAAEPADNRIVDQLHAARHHFRSIAVDRAEVIAIAEQMQRNFKSADVLVTVVAGTEQSILLSTFRTQHFNSDQATIIKLFAQEPEGSGLKRMSLVEFGPHVNYAMTQGPDEAWVLGALETLKKSIRRFERVYATNFKLLGGSINQILLLLALVLLPSLDSVPRRMIFMAGVVAILWGMDRLYNRYLPVAALYLGTKPQGLLARFLPSAASWVMAILGAVAALILFEYLKVPLQLPS